MADTAVTTPLINKFITTTSSNYSRAYGDGPRNFEQRSSVDDETRAGTPSPNYHTNGGCLNSRQILLVSFPYTAGL
ncbi:hypothetical protein TNCV_4480041 [Trichonephila clavipes]|nr:hypothetical protein TNCV_4480041 [Trichonephila clavipes]